VEDDTGMMNSEDEDRLDGDSDDPCLCDCGQEKSVSEAFCKECMEQAAWEARCDREHRPY
jgi:hypothetical protein